MKGAKLLDKPNSSSIPISTVPFGQPQKVSIYPDLKVSKQASESYYEVSIGDKLAYLSIADAADNPPIVDHQVNTEKLIGQYEIENYAGTPSKLNLFSDGSAAIVLNFCVAMVSFTAKWRIKGTTLTVFSIPDRFKTWIVDQTLDFYVEPNGTLHYMGEDVYACSLSGDWNDDLRLLKKR